MNDIIEFDFKGTPIHVLRFKGREVWTAQEVAVGLGYADSKYFTDKINGDWSEEFEAGIDFFKAEGEDLNGLRSLFAVGDSPTANPIHPMTRSLLLLTESGVNLACTLARTRRGRRFRRWLAREVLPALRRGEAPACLDVEDPPEQLGATEAMVALQSLKALRRLRRISAEDLGDELLALYERITRRPIATCPVRRALTDPGEPQDLVERWFVERTEPGGKTLTRDLWDDFVRWRGVDGRHITKRQFERAMTPIAGKALHYYHSANGRQTKGRGHAVHIKAAYQEEVSP